MSKLIDVYVNLLNIAEVLKHEVTGPGNKKEPLLGPFSMAWQEDVERIKTGNELIDTRLAAYKNVAHWVFWLAKKNNPNLNEEEFYKECGL